MTYRNLPLFIFRVQSPKAEILGPKSRKSRFCSIPCIQPIGRPRENSTGAFGWNDGKKLKLMKQM
nr:MAG TPA: hypothetical protein [Caudoviricetes sp.]